MTARLRQEVHVWLARPEPWPLAQLERSYLALLSKEERQRCLRFHFERDRKHYLAAHAMLRLCLARHLDCTPQQVSLAPGLNGKPEIALDSAQPSLRFNLSHTRGMVACAVTRAGACGIDVEGIRTMPDINGIAQTVFSSSEIDYLDSHDAATRPLAFFTQWTLKEAYIKATGLGMSAPLRQIAVDARTLRVRDDSRPEQDAGDWLFDSWQAGPGHALALACDGADMLRSIICHEMDLATASLQILRRKEIGSLQT
ncbi:4'-phosphopantetheinyl transferase family protein [Noviherbaspirillum sedimenti]|nr:4'-phosphopantetheinyl transferase superfamily protein [Noviherbaspirillum sedimenti]